jgi:hypothetical protein
MIADFGCADVLVNGEDTRKAMLDDIGTSALSFKKIWSLVNEDFRRNKIKPSDVERTIELDKRFITTDELMKESFKRRLGEASSSARKQLAF